MTSHTYAFHLGRQKDLSQAEIFSVLEQQHVHIDNPRTVGEYLLISTSTPIDVPALMDTLGGTRLIGDKLDAQGDAKDTISHYLESLPTDKKLHFSVSGGRHAETIAIEVKKKLKQAGRSVRFVKVMNTATILHNGLIERGTHLTVIDNVVYVTRAIQPIEDMSERDYGRPQPDGFNGMLPPKLARMMINLTAPKKTDTLLDPFCGSGTLLGEAMSLGMEEIIGSDISEKAISDTTKNLAWLKNNLSTQGGQSVVSNLQLFNSDVRTLTSYIAPKTVDVIATEPLLGVPRKGREPRTFLLEQSRELKSLYLDAFAVFKKILKSGGRVVFVIPRFKHNDNWITIDCKKEIETLGFELLPYCEGLEMPLVYHRDGQHVGREIWRWKKSV